MLRLLQLPGIQQLNDAAGVHHRHAIAEVRHQRQIVANQNQPHAARRYQLVNQLEDLRLHRGIQRAGGFIGD